MTLKVNNLPAGGKQVDPMEPGTYPARTVIIADLGIQAQRPYKGEEKPAVPMISITYEFVDEFLKGEDGKDLTDKPRWLSETMPLYSLGADRAKSTIRYLAIDPKKVHGGDFSKLIDTPCMVTVVHNPDKKDPARVYENISGVVAMRDKDAATCAELVNPSAVFDFDEPDLEVFDRLPRFVQEKIKGGLEYNGSKLQAALGGGEMSTEEEASEATEKGAIYKEESDTDENPY
jgi:hypothetical protein